MDSVDKIQFRQQVNQFFRKSVSWYQRQDRYECNFGIVAQAQAQDRPQRSSQEKHVTQDGFPSKTALTSRGNHGQPKTVYGIPNEKGCYIHEKTNVTIEEKVKP